MGIAGWAKTLLLALSLCVALVGQAYAQDSGGGESSPKQPIAGPVLGYVLDEAAGGLRALLGIPGASTIGGLLDIGQPLKYAYISPVQNYALVVTANTEEVLLVHLLENEFSVRPFEELASGATQIFLSPAGSSAAVYYRATRTINIVRGLPDELSPVAELHISNLPGSLTAMAISDDAAVILLGVLDGESGLILEASVREGLETTIPDAELRSRRVRGSPRRFPVPVPLRIVSAVGHASAISFLKDSHDALIADLVKDEIVLIRDVAITWQKVRVAGLENGISRPVGAAISTDHRRLFVANSGTGTVSVLDFTTGVTSVTRILPCQCIPSGLYQLAGDSVFRLTDASNSPLLILDGGASEPRIVFIPAGPD